MDELKKYLTLNTDNIGDDLPSKKVWMNIALQMDSVTENEKYISPVIFSIFKYAVAACVVLLAGVGVWSLTHNNSQPSVVYVKNDSANIVEMQTDTEFTAASIPDSPFSILHSTASNAVETADRNEAILKQNLPAKNNYLVQVKNVDSQFNQVINIQKNIISKTAIYTESPDYFKDFMTGYKQMEEDEKGIKKDIVAMGFTNDLLEQLINVNQQKLNLLKQLLVEINKTNNRFKQNRNLLDTVKVYYLEM